MMPADHMDRVWGLMARVLLAGLVETAVAALRAVQQDPALQPSYAAQIAVEALELATLHLIRNESPEMVAAFAGKLPVLIWTVRR